MVVLAVMSIAVSSQRAHTDYYSSYGLSSFEEIGNIHAMPDSLQEMKTREFRTRLLGFGQFCRFQNRSQEPIASVSGGTRFYSGIFVGIDQRTGQYMIYSDDSIKLARTVVRVPTLEKWDRESLSAVKATPHSLHVPKDMEIVFKEKVDIGVAPEQAQSIARQLYLYPSDFIGPNGFGLSRGCPKCVTFS